jgi:hypothetical protein
MKLFGLNLGSLFEKISPSLKRQYNLETDEGKPFRLMRKEQFYEIIDISKKASTIGGNVVEHLCKQLINIRLLSEQLVSSQNENNFKATKAIIKDLEKII